MGQLSAGERESMLHLLSDHFENVTSEGFAADLAEKEWAILVCRDGVLGGFSTLTRLRARVSGVPVLAFFSGDTIVDRQFQGYSQLSRLWSRHTFALAQAERWREPATRVYWLLISAGYKTYRTLPLFYRRFHPAVDREATAFEREVADVLTSSRFGHEFDREAGVVRLARPAPLRSGVAEPSEARRRDPHVEFFLSANPGHALGDELVCLTELHPRNLTRAGRRMVGADLAGPEAAPREATGVSRARS